jgi:hypothetical protein
MFKSQSILFKKRPYVFLLFKKFTNNTNNNYIPPTCYEIQDVKYNIILNELNKIKTMQHINYCLLLINVLVSAIL